MVAMVAPAAACDRDKYYRATHLSLLVGHLLLSIRPRCLLLLLFRAVATGGKGARGLPRPPRFGPELKLNPRLQKALGFELDTIPDFQPFLRFYYLQPHGGSNIFP